MIRYQYAKTASAGALNIAEVTPETRKAFGVFTCLGCERELVPVLPSGRQKHFRHKVDPDGSCSPESYLHHLAKTAIYDAYNEALKSQRPFYLHLPVKRRCTRWKSQFGFECRLPDGSRKIDLTRHYKKAELEVAIDGFRADILLGDSRNRQPLLVEVVVTHECEKAKIESGHKILEIWVDYEEDVERVKQGFNTTGLRIFKMHNFREQQEKEGPCQMDCPRRVSVFRVFKSGKSHFISCRPAAVRKLTRHPSVAYWHLGPELSEHELTGYLAFDGWRTEAEKAYRAGAPIKGCSLCRYAGFNTVEHPVFCKLHRKEVGHNFAAKCEAYRPR